MIIRSILSCCLLSLVLQSCGEDSATARLMEPSDALWITGDSQSLTEESLGALSSVGVKLYFLEVGKISWLGDRPVLEYQPIPPLTFPAKAILALKGEGPSQGLDQKHVGRDLVREIESLQQQVRQSDLQIIGINLELTGFDDFEAYAGLLKSLHKAMGKSLSLSVTLPRRWVEKAGVEEMFRWTDFVVPMLYGQLPGVSEDPKAWDFQVMEALVRRLESFEEPYFIGVITLGTASFSGASGSVKERTSRVRLEEFIHNPNITMGHGFSLKGIDRLVYVFDVEKATEVEGVKMAARSKLRIVRTTSIHQEELRRLLGAWETPHLLGEAFYRIPSDGENLSLSADNLVNALSARSVLPSPKVSIKVLRRSGSRQRIQVRLENESVEPTDIALVGSNFVELKLRSDTAYFKNVRIGLFKRYDFLRLNQAGKEIRSFRDPTILRFYIPILGSEAVMDSGPVDIVGRGSSRVEIDVSATFLVPAGKTASFGPETFSLPLGRFKETQKLP